MNEENVNDYIIVSDNSADINEVKVEYEENVNLEYDEYESVSDKVLCLSLTEEEAEELEEDDRYQLEPDVIVEACDVENETKPAEVISGMEQVYIDMINADESIVEEEKKDKEISSDNPVKIAIIDSGIDDCSDVYVTGRINLISGQEELTTFYEDETGHGTAIAGVIASQNEDTQVVGINNDVEIYSAKVLDGNNQAPLSRVLEGIYWAIDMKVDIINMSFGIRQESEALRAAIEKADEAGILLVAAVGNNGNSVNNNAVLYPAAFDNVLGVGAVDTQARHCDYSAEGNEVDIVAVGEQIVTTGVLDGVTVTDGTSMAVPQVVAVASLIWEKDRSVSSEFIRRIIMESANRLGDPSQYGSGLIDLEEAYKIYDEFYQTYQEEEPCDETAELDKPDKAIDTYMLPDCVSGMWTGKTHTSIVASADVYTGDKLKAIKAGCVFNDSKDYGKASLYGLVSKKYGDNGDWHGRESKKYNYAHAFAYVYEMSYSGLGNYKYCPSYMKANQFTRMSSRFKKVYDDNKSDSPMSKFMKFKNVKVNNENKRYFVLGMALHILSDTYAHSAYEKKGDGYVHIKHDGKPSTDRNSPDNKEKVKPRWKAAKQAVKKALNQYKKRKTDNKSLTEKPFIYTLIYGITGANYDYNSYKIRGLYKRLEKFYNREKNNSSINGVTVLDCRGNYVHYQTLLMNMSFDKDIDNVKSVDSNVPTTKKRNKLQALLFDPFYYYNRYEDLQKAFGYSPEKLKKHYYNQGIKEGRSASWYFDPLYYVDKNDDVYEMFKEDYSSAYAHFLNYGFWEGKSGSMYFDADYYLEENGDVTKEYGDNYLDAATHFKSCGMGEWRIASEDFDVKYYKENYPNLARDKGYSIPIDYYFHHAIYGVFEMHDCIRDEVTETLCKALSGDFSGDGISDICDVYSCTTPNNTCKGIRLSVRKSNRSGFAEVEGFEGCLSADIDINAAQNRTVSGDFNGDGRCDAAVLCETKDRMMKWYVFLSTGTGFITSEWFSLNASDFEPTRNDGRVASGDFNGDGRCDVATMYDCGGACSDIFVFLSNGAGFTVSRWYSSGAGNCEAFRATGRFTSGDYNNDGKCDLAMMYDYGNDFASIFIFHSVGYGFTLERWYDSGAGNLRASLATGRFVSGKFTDDNICDLAMMYDYGGDNTSIFVFKSLGNSLAMEWWYASGAGNYRASLATDRFVGGDYNGDRYDDLCAVYDYGSMIANHMWLSNGKGLLPVSTWWTSD